MAILKQGIVNIDILVEALQNFGHTLTRLQESTNTPDSEEVWNQITKILESQLEYYLSEKKKLENECDQLVKGFT